MYNGFTPNKTFWTDSNSLVMLKRQIKDYGAPEYTISGNYYPINSAIAMRSTSSNLQVTVMNDRAQGGAADLMDSGAIELMQNRRLFD